jgi:hypothetical protein
MFVLVVFAGCGDGDVALGGTSSESTAMGTSSTAPADPPRACAARDPAVSAFAWIASCTSPGECASLWESEPDEGTSVLATGSVECELKSVAALDGLRRRYSFGACTSEGAAPEPDVELLTEIGPIAELPLEPGDTTTIEWQYEHTAWGYDRRESWVLRRPDGTPVFAFSGEDGLPRDDLTAPLAIEASDQDCDEMPGACGGGTAKQEMTFSVADASVTVPEGNHGVLEGEGGSYDVFVETANRGYDMACGLYGGWQRYTFAVVAE